MATLVSQVEISEVLDNVHHFCYLSMVNSEMPRPETTATLIMNDGLSSNGKRNNFSHKNKVPTNCIEDSLQSLIVFRLYLHGYLSDISKCYLMVRVDKLTLRLFFCQEHGKRNNLTP